MKLGGGSEVALAGAENEARLHFFCSSTLHLPNSFRVDACPSVGILPWGKKPAKCPPPSCPLNLKTSRDPKLAAHNKMGKTFRSSVVEHQYAKSK